MYFFALFYFIFLVSTCQFVVPITLTLGLELWLSLANEMLSNCNTNINLKALFNWTCLLFILPLLWEHAQVNLLELERHRITPVFLVEAILNNVTTSPLSPMWASLAKTRRLPNQPSKILNCNSALPDSKKLFLIVTYKLCFDVGTCNYFDIK